MEFVMEHSVFRAWLAEVDDFTVDQRLELERCWPDGLRVRR
jgi:hypothetical protein